MRSYLARSRSGSSPTQRVGPAHPGACARALRCDPRAIGVACAAARIRLRATPRCGRALLRARAQTQSLR